jgi:hypothetical protein
MGGFGLVGTSAKTWELRQNPYSGHAQYFAQLRLSLFCPAEYRLTSWPSGSLR